MNRKDTDWLKLIGIVLVVLIVGIILGGCQLFEKNRDTDSECVVTCSNCKDLTVQCEHGTERENKYTVNQPDEQGQEESQD